MSADIVVIQAADIPVVPHMEREEILERWKEIHACMRFEVERSFEYDTHKTGARHPAMKNSLSSNNGYLPIGCKKPTDDEKVEAFDKFRSSIIYSLKEHLYDAASQCTPNSALKYVLKGRFAHIEVLFGFVINARFCDAVSAAAYEDRIAGSLNADQRREKMAGRMDWYRDCLRPRIEAGEPAAVRAAVELEKLEAKMYGVVKQKEDSTMAELVSLAQQGYSQRKAALLVRDTGQQKITVQPGDLLSRLKARRDAGATIEAEPAE